MKGRAHDTAMAEHFRADPTCAQELLAEVGRDGNQAEQGILLRQMVTAFGMKHVDVGGKLSDWLLATKGPQFTREQPS